MKLITIKNYLLLIDEKAEIKEGDIVVHNFGMGYEIEEPCDKDNLKSNTRSKIIAYYPLAKEAKELDLPLLPNPFEDCDVSYLEKQSENYYEELYKSGAVKPHEKSWIKSIYQVIFKTGYKAAQSKTSFTLEDIKKAIEFAYNAGRRVERNAVPADFKFETYREDFIQSLSTQQLPKEFIPEYEEIEVDKYVPKMPIDTIKTITNSEGKEVLVGTYKY